MLTTKERQSIGLLTPFIGNVHQLRPLLQKVFFYVDIILWAAYILDEYKIKYIPRIRRIGGCYGFTSKPPAARRPQWC